MAPAARGAGAPPPPLQDHRARRRREKPAVGLGLQRHGRRRAAVVVADQVPDTAGEAAEPGHRAVGGRARGRLNDGGGAG